MNEWITMKARNTLLLIFFISAFPLVAACATYFLWQPTKRMNHGDLLKPTTVPVSAMTTAEGGSFDLTTLRGKWIMVQMDASTCDERCRTKLYTMRQIRVAQGKDMLRLERVWLLTDDKLPLPELLKEHEGIRVVRAAGSPLLAALKLQTPVDSTASIYMIDPMGNLMMRFPQSTDPVGMIKDLNRLLRPGRIGA